MRDSTGQQLTPFVCATQNLILQNKKWQEQLKNERERVRRTLITGSYATADDPLDLDVPDDASVTVRTLNDDNDDNNNFESYHSIPPVVSIATNLPTQKSIADEFTLNREQRAAFMIITSHLDGDSQCRTGNFIFNAIYRSKIIILTVCLSIRRSQQWPADHVHTWLRWYRKIATYSCTQ